MQIERDKKMRLGACGPDTEDSGYTLPLSGDERAPEGGALMQFILGVIFFVAVVVVLGLGVSGIGGSL